MSFLKENVVYPKMYRIKQHFANDRIEDIKTEIYNQFDIIGLKDKIKPDGQIGITCAAEE